VRNGDRGAYGRLVERYGGAVYGVAYAYLHNRADVEDAK